MNWILSHPPIVKFGRAASATLPSLVQHRPGQFRGFLSSRLQNYNGSYEFWLSFEVHRGERRDFDNAKADEGFFLPLGLVLACCTCDPQPGAKFRILSISKPLEAESISERGTRPDRK